MAVVAEISQVARKPKRYRTLVGWLLILTLLCVVVGALVSLFWANTVQLPQYLVLSDGSTRLSERELVEFASADFWYVVCAILVGPAMGWLTWRWFKPLGWATALVAVAAGFLTGLICWGSGEIFGPGAFAERLVIAQPGDLVPLSLDLRATSALFVWPLAAIVPVLIAATISPENTSETETDHVPLVASAGEN
ncbi:MAG: chloride channel protein [Propionibacteriaceae bacterium]|nr:chloride channel protein [Propionibacteriaceae bacterium]